MTKKDKTLIAEGLNRICADVAALAAILGDTDAPPGKKQAAGAPPETPVPTEEPTDATPKLICAADVPDPEPVNDTSEPAEPTPGPAEATGKETEKNRLPKYEDVRAVLAEKARTGYRAEVKALLTKHGVKQLSDITDPEEYATLMKEAGGIGDG